MAYFKCFQVQICIKDVTGWAYIFENLDVLHINVVYDRKLSSNKYKYSSVPNNCVGWNKCLGWNFHPKLINVQAGIIVQVGKFLNI